MEKERRRENEGNFNAKKQSSKAGQGESAPMDTRVLHLNPVECRIYRRASMPHELKCSHVIKQLQRRRSHLIT